MVGLARALITKAVVGNRTRRDMDKAQVQRVNKSARTNSRFILCNHGAVGQGGGRRGASSCGCGNHVLDVGQGCDSAVF